jgi:beta-lactamase regulating signal transducer with metallopeptidase domain
MTPASQLHAIAQFSALRIVDSVVEGTLIGMFAALLLGVARRQSASSRFAVWFSALVSIAVLPFISGGWWSHGASASMNHASITLPDSWAFYLFWAWAAIAVWSLVGVGRALWHLRALRSSCVPVDLAALDPLLQETIRRNQAKRPVELCTSEQVRVPTAIGLLSPMVVIPGWVMKELSPKELNQILLHELAHVQRWDDWTNLAQQVARAIFFFHPAVWWIEKKLALECEIACDDAVLAETSSPRAYAECLAHLAERTLVQRSLALAQAALGRIRQTSLRVTQILDVDRPTGRSRNWKLAATLAGFAVMCGSLASSMPRLIAFREEAPVLVSKPAISISTISPPVSGGQNSEISLPGAVAYSVRPQAERITQTSFDTHRGHRDPHLLVQRVALRNNPKPQTRGMVPLTKAQTVPISVTETVFVLVEGLRSDRLDQPVYQIQMWRLTVLRQAVEPNSAQLPRKET